jgi:hypothetical protein
VKKAAKKTSCLPFEKQAELALRAAVKRVIDESARLGLPLYVGHEGKVVELAADNPPLISRTRLRKADG